MARLHQQFIEFNSRIRLTDVRISSLKTSRKDLRKKIRNWFKENKPDELPPKFGPQGSIVMGTGVNPIPVTDAAGKQLLKYDLDDGVYFLERDGEDNRQGVSIWRDWLTSSVDGHTNTPPERHKSCIRVIFSDGHHIDLPLYYKKGDVIELAHNDSAWIESDPKAFYDWFNNQATPQLIRIVRYLKAWKNFHDTQNKGAVIASGFALTILATNNFSSNDNDDVAFRKTVTAIRDELKRDFKCLRPTTPKDENVFESYSNADRDSFLKVLDELVAVCDDAEAEKNERKATELMRGQFGDRFPLGADIDTEKKAQGLATGLSSTYVPAKPYAE